MKTELLPTHKHFVYILLFYVPINGGLKMSGLGFVSLKSKVYNLLLLLYNVL